MFVVIVGMIEHASFELVDSKRSLEKKPLRIHLDEASDASDDRTFYKRALPHDEDDDNDDDDDVAYEGRAKRAFNLSHLSLVRLVPFGGFSLGAFNAVFFGILVVLMKMVGSMFIFQPVAQTLF